MRPSVRAATHEDTGAAHRPLLVGARRRHEYAARRRARDRGGEDRQRSKPRSAPSAPSGSGSRAAAGRERRRDRDARRRARFDAPSRSRGGRATPRNAARRSAMSESPSSTADKERLEARGSAARRASGSAASPRTATARGAKQLRRELAAKPALRIRRRERQRCARTSPRSRRTSQIVAPGGTSSSRKNGRSAARVGEL